MFADIGTSWFVYQPFFTDIGGHGVVQDEWVVCRIFQKSSGGKRSFLFSHVQQLHGGYMEDARSSLPPMVENSPNPTVTDDGACTDCETCAGTDQMSCYNCVPGDKDPSHNVLSWLSQPMELPMVPAIPYNLSAPSLHRPKTEPEGEDEAQSLPKGFDYGSLYNVEEDPTSGTDPQSSCLTGSLCSGSESFTFKYRLQDLPAPVDSHEILWAY